MLNNSYSQTQTKTQPKTQTQTQHQLNNTNNNTRLFNRSLFDSNPNFLNSNTSSNNQTNQTNQTNDDAILFAVITGNLNELTRLINNDNINNIIDKKNKYTALHHAVRIKRNDHIVDYLLECGANPHLIQDEGKDAIDLSIESNYRYLINKIIKEKDIKLEQLHDKYDDIKYKYKQSENVNKELKKQNDELEKKNMYLQKSNDEYAVKINQVQIENANTKRKLEQSEKAFENLLKKSKRND